MADRKLSRRRFLGVAFAAAVSASATPGSAGAVRSAARRRDGKHFVLIHGAWHGAWCWYKIVAGLEEAGQRATALDLPSGGIDGSPPDTVTLEAQANRVIALLDSLSEPVVLVGHSAGGAVISLVAEARPQKVEKLARRRWSVRWRRSRTPRFQGGSCGAPTIPPESGAPLPTARGPSPMMMIAPFAAAHTTQRLPSHTQ